MPYVFYDAPADSAELETYNGYHVARAPLVASGGPVKRDDPSEHPDELILSHPNTSRARPRRTRNCSRPNAMTRVIPGRAFSIDRFLSAKEAVTLLSVPSLSFCLIWLMGRI